MLAHRVTYESFGKISKISIFNWLQCVCNILSDVQIKEML